MSKLSVVCCVFNAELFVRESLDSVFNQTFEDFEVILINDGSTDRTKDVLLEYLELPNVRLLENKYNEGVPISRNRGFLEAQGEYIAIHDADDISLSHRFETQINYLDENPEITVVGGYAKKISETGQDVGSMVYPQYCKDTEHAFRSIVRFKLNPVIDPSCMFRKEHIIREGGYTTDPEFRYVQDFHLWCRLLRKGYHLANIPDFLIKYRVNSNGITRLKKEEMDVATDMVCASFKRNSFGKVILDKEYYMQENFVECRKEIE